MLTFSNDRACRCHRRVSAQTRKGKRNSGTGSLKFVTVSCSTHYLSPPKCLPVSNRFQIDSQRLSDSTPPFMKNNIQLSAVEDHDGILTIRGGGAQRNWNGIHYKQGMSAKNVGTKSLSANIATIPPGGVAYAHIHVDFEVILYIIEGKVRHEFGTGL